MDELAPYPSPAPSHTRTKVFLIHRVYSSAFSLIFTIKATFSQTRKTF